ncbi:PREDICTED: uncharacterized protein LOC109468212 [Branchiostoma belcheri]|uniref:Uncharacterized protein LOC109468212 n=1 Tax=Branchiostoma belcheri TaxID=7741 RepID=A0A6P4YJS6_BRABE|nr:PREDICTED: uncharacterized protein LOC109468212 [Branchiostoma belcheri]
MSSTTPEWLEGCKHHVTETNEWKSFTVELFDAIQQQLTESHVKYFSDLSEAEKELFMERAVRAIQHGSSFTTLNAQVSKMLDMALNNEVARELLEDHPVNTKSDLVLGHARDGAVSLLQRWPDMRDKLHLCLNQPLPPTLRQLAWKLHLRNSKLRRQYATAVKTESPSLKSPWHREICQKCEDILQSEPTFKPLANHYGVLTAMQSVLSYYHASLQTASTLPDMDYLLLVPFLAVTQNTLSVDAPAGDNVKALLVEEFITYMAQRPGYMREAGVRDFSDEKSVFADTVADLLQQHDDHLATAISTAFATDKGNPSRTNLVQGLKTLLQPLLRVMFVGYLQLDCLLYIWDQYIIGLDVPAYQVLPTISTVLLMLLREHFFKCKNSHQMEQVLSSHSRKLHMHQFQYEINKRFYRTLHAQIHKDDKSTMPVLDPTQSVGMPPPWTHWSVEKLPPRQKAHDRRQAREEREAQRLRFVEQQKAEVEMKQEDELARRREEERQLELALEQSRRQQDQERLALEQELDAERQARYELQKRADDQIAMLQKQIDELKRMKDTKPKSAAPSETLSTFSLKAPPPSAATHVTRTWPVAPSPARSEPSRTPGTPDAVKAETIMRDLVGRIMQGTNFLAHSSGDEKDTLDQQTRQSLQAYNKDRREAEIEIFGRRISSRDWNTMASGERTNTQGRLADAVRRKVEQRHGSNSRQGTNSRHGTSSRH